jgi:hypothetical protein
MEKGDIFGGEKRQSVLLKMKYLQRKPEGG